MIKSLIAQNKPIAGGEEQLRLLSLVDVPAFEQKLAGDGLNPLLPTGLEILQINVGKLCNQTCRHCHVDAGPDRREMMSRETFQQCLDVVEKFGIPTVDITGGAPELNPEFRWFVEQLHARGKKVIVRCNLTVILSNKKYHDLPEFFKANQVEVVSSLPHYNMRRTDSQRGEGVFEKSMEAMRMLNAVGYGVENSGLVLNLVYNPSGSFLPGDQALLEREFKDALRKHHNITFNHLFCITNMPVSRFLDHLLESGNLEGYMKKLVDAYNPAAARNVMCRNLISVSWDGKLYDCDFNQMLEMEIDPDVSPSLKDFDLEKINQRKIRVHQHCYGCTAGAGSSCGGEIA